MQVLVVGAGVVGLGVARAAALAGHEVIITEAADAIGTGTSSRNSEVIHAGLYYPPGSIRAALCPRGRRQLYAYCETHGINHRKTGKLVVATKDAETDKVEAILAQSLANGVEGVRMMSRAEAVALEPALTCVAAMNSPETGIIDSHGLMLALQGEVEDHGGAIAFNTPVERLVPTATGWDVHYGGAEPGMLTVDAVVNCAGHGAQRLAGATEGYPAVAGAATRPLQGQLFQLSGPAGVFAADLSSAARPRRSRRPRHPRSRRPHALRPRRPMDGGRGPGIQRRSIPRRRFLRRHPHLLAGAPRCEPSPRLLRHPPSDQRPGRTASRFRHRPAGRPRSAAPRPACSASSRRA